MRRDQSAPVMMGHAGTGECLFGIAGPIKADADIPLDELAARIRSSPQGRSKDRLHTICVASTGH